MQRMVVSLVMSAATALSVLAAPPAAAQTPAAALAQVQPGLWRLDLGGGAQRLFCLDDVSRLVQIEDRDQAGCTRRVISDAGDAATVNYDCPRGGWGRTSIRVVTASLVRVDAQGIARNAPFAYQAIGRRIGACPLARR